MLPSGHPTKQEIWKIARRTTDIIETNITPNVCIFGSAASSLWVDIGRVPKVRRCYLHHLSIPLSIDRLVFDTQDVDIVVSREDWEESDPRYIAELIKEKIVQVDRRYYLQRSGIRGAKYRILYCRLPGWASDKTRRVKVDILVPPTLNLPAISEYERDHIYNIPVMPIFDLLIMKTQGWWHHRESDRRDFRAKEKDDVSYIFALLECAKQENVSYADEANKHRHSRKFMDHAQSLVNKFVPVYGGHQEWRAIGFRV